MPVSWRIFDAQAEWCQRFLRQSGSGPKRAPGGRRSGIDMSQSPRGPFTARLCPDAVQKHLPARKTGHLVSRG